MTTVAIVEHTYEWCGRDETKMIGVYANREDAAAAVTRLRDQPGFCDWPDGFTIEEHQVGEDHWKEGFETSVTALLPPTGPGGQHCPIEVIWRPGNQYKIAAGNDRELAAHPYEIGDVVRCLEATMDDGSQALVVVEKA